MKNIIVTDEQHAALLVALEDLDPARPEWSAADRALSEVEENITTAPEAVVITDTIREALISAADDRRRITKLEDDDAYALIDWSRFDDEAARVVYALCDALGIDYTTPEA